MSFLKTISEAFKVKCASCKKPLDFSRKTSMMFMAESMAASPYRCRACNTICCMSCAETVPCTKCGGKVFDSALG
jgi:hypothetical protein